MAAQKETKTFLLLIKGGDWSEGLSPEETQRIMEEAMAWFEGLEAKGMMKDGSPLDGTGHVVSADSRGVVSDGPFVETKEAVGGYLMLEAESIEEVIAAARTSPVLKHGMVAEIRPVLEECPIQKRLRELKAHAGA